MSNNTFDLNDIDQEETFNDTTDPADSGSVPDGKYTVFVDKVELKFTKNNNRRLAWNLRIIEPTHVGRMIFTGHMLETEQSRGWLKRALLTCNLKLDRWSELPGRLNDLLNVVLEVTVKTNGQYTNVYFNKRIDLDAGTSPQEMMEAQKAQDPARADALDALQEDTVPF